MDSRLVIKKDFLGVSTQRGYRFIVEKDGVEVADISSAITSFSFQGDDDSVAECSISFLAGKVRIESAAPKDNNAEQSITISLEERVERLEQAVDTLNMRTMHNIRFGG